MSGAKVSNIKRYEMVQAGDITGTYGEMIEQELGDWVRAEDYETLRTERDEAWAERERWLCSHRGVDTPCKKCGGLGVVAYGSTATFWRGAGGQQITVAVCDNCWGSGDADRHGADLIQMRNMCDGLRVERDEARHAAAVLAHSYETGNNPPQRIVKLAMGWTLEAEKNKCPI